MSTLKSVVDMLKTLIQPVIDAVKTLKGPLGDLAEMPPFDLIFDALKEVLVVIRDLFLLLFRFLMLLEELLAKLWNLLVERAKQLWKILEKIWDLSCDTYDLMKAEWRKRKRDAEVKKARAIELKEEAKRKAEEAKKEAEAKLAAAEATCNEMIRAEAEMTKNTLEAEAAQMKAEGELLEKEAEAELKEAIEGVENSDKKKAESKSRLARFKDWSVGIIKRAWNWFKQMFDKTMNTIKSGILKTLYDVMDAEPSPLFEELEKMMEAAMKTAGGTFDVVLGIVGKIMKTIGDVVDSISMKVRDRQETLDEEEFNYEMERLEQEMMDEGMYDEFCTEPEDLGDPEQMMA